MKKKYTYVITLLAGLVSYLPAITLAEVCPAVESLQFKPSWAITGYSVIVPSDWKLDPTTWPNPQSPIRPVSSYQWGNTDY